MHSDSSCTQEAGGLIKVARKTSKDGMDEFKKLRDAKLSEHLQKIADRRLVCEKQLDEIKAEYASKIKGDNIFCPRDCICEHLFRVLDRFSRLP